MSRWSWAALWPCHIPFVIGLGTVVILDAVLIGILHTVFGFSIMDTPIESQELLTMFLEAFFIVVGIVRIVVALMENFPPWEWTLLNGIVNVRLLREPIP